MLKSVARRAALAAVATLLSLACADPTTELSGAPTVTGTGSTVRLLNDGAVTLTRVRVRTSERDSLPEVATLAPGQTSAAYTVGEIRSAPLVESVAAGLPLVALPIEGFSGFNPALERGAYVVRVRLAGELLDVRVVRADP